MGLEEHVAKAPRSVRCAVLTVSDTRTELNDESGALIKELLSRAGHVVAGYRLIPNEKALIKSVVNGLVASAEVQAVIATGGTGLGRRDVTVEAVSEIVEKRLEGFGELFRFLSYQRIGSAAMMSRALLGVKSGKPIFCLPGSRGAVELAMGELIIPQLGHIVLVLSQ